MFAQSLIVTVQAFHSWQELSHLCSQDDGVGSTSEMPMTLPKIGKSTTLLNDFPTEREATKSSCHCLFSLCFCAWWASGEGKFDFTVKVYIVCILHIFCMCVSTAAAVEKGGSYHQKWKDSRKNRDVFYNITYASEFGCLMSTADTSDSSWQVVCSTSCLHVLWSSHVRVGLFKSNTSMRMDKRTGEMQVFCDNGDSYNTCWTNAQWRLNQVW